MRQITQFIAISCLAGYLGGCASQTAVEADFGNSVKQVLGAQIANPERVANPPSEMPAHTMGPRLNNALEVYQQSVGDPRTINESISVGTGQNQGN